MCSNRDTLRCSLDKRIQQPPVRIVSAVATRLLLCGSGTTCYNFQSLRECRGGYDTAVGSVSIFFRKGKRVINCTAVKEFYFYSVHRYNCHIRMNTLTVQLETLRFRTVKLTLSFIFLIEYYNNVYLINTYKRLIFIMVNYFF